MLKRSRRSSSLSRREATPGGRGHWCWVVAPPTTGLVGGSCHGFHWHVKWELSPPAEKGEEMERFEMATVHQLGRCCGTVQRGTPGEAGLLAPACGIAEPSSG